MATISTQIVLGQLPSGLSASSYVSRSVQDEDFSSITIGIDTTAHKISTSDVGSASEVLVSLISGDPVRIGFSSSVLPMSISREGQGALIPLFSQSKHVVTSVSNVGDVLTNKYFDIPNENGIVRVWFDPDPDSPEGDYAAVSILYGAPDTGDTVTLNGVTFTCGTGPGEFSTQEELADLIQSDSLFNAEVAGAYIYASSATPGTAQNSWAAILGGGNTGTMAVSGATFSGGTLPQIPPAIPDGFGSRLLSVTVSNTYDLNSVGSAIAAAFYADPSFSASFSTPDVTITPTIPGVASPISAGTSGLAVSTSITSPPGDVWIKSSGASQVKIAVAP